MKALSINECYCYSKIKSSASIAAVDGMVALMELQRLRH